MKRFLTQGIVGHWNKLPSEVVIAPSLRIQELLGQHSHTRAGFFCEGPGAGPNDPWCSLTTQGIL